MLHSGSSLAKAAGSAARDILIPNSCSADSTSPRLSVLNWNAVARSMKPAILRLRIRAPSPHDARPPGRAGRPHTAVGRVSAVNLHDALRSACADVGILCRDVPADGRWYETDVEGDRRGRGDGRIKLFPDGEGGIVCNWKGETRPFFADDGRKPSDAERRELSAGCWRYPTSARIVPRARRTSTTLRGRAAQRP